MLHVIEDLQVGGGQKLVLDVLRHLDPARTEALVAYLRPEHAMRGEYTRAGIATACLGHQGGWRSVRTLAALVRLVRNFRPDVLHAHSSLDMRYAVAASLLCQVPVVSHLHMPHHYGNQTALRRRMRTWAGKLTVSRYIAITEAVREAHVAHVPDPEHRLELVYNGVCAQEIAAASGVDSHQLRLTLGLDDAYPILVNVGRLHPQKGQRLLIPTLALVRRTWPTAKLLIVGEGPERVALEHEIEAAGLEGAVLLLGDRQDVPALLGISDAFVLSSRAEGFGLVVAESMAAGKPVIALDLPVLRELIEDGITGYLVQDRTPAALAATILHVLSHPDEAGAVADQGRRAVSQRFDIATCARKIEDLYTTVTQESQGRSDGRRLSRLRVSSPQHQHAGPPHRS